MSNCKAELAEPRRGRRGRKAYVFLTAAEVQAVRVRAARGHKTRVLAAEFRVREATIRNIVRPSSASRGRRPGT